jgi:hypothetical protein
MRVTLLILGIVFMSSVLVGCETVRLYEKERVTVSVPVYENQNHPIEETYYDTERQSYEVTEMKTETYTIPPLISGDNLVLALTRLAGGTREEGERVQTALDIGFSTLYAENKERNITLIPRVRLLLELTEAELQGQGPSVVKVLTEKFGVNIICTGTILDSNAGAPKRLRVQILNLNTDEFLTEEFSGETWEQVGTQIASAFFGTRIGTQEVPHVVTKYRNVRVPKTRLIDNWEDVQIGEKNEYRIKEVYKGEQNIFSAMALMTDLVWGGIGGVVGYLALPTDWSPTNQVIGSIGIGLGSAVILNLVLNQFLEPRKVVR